jgi:chromosome segregation ATPase
VKNLVLILVLVAGLVAGYFVGDYRGREARLALAKAIEAGKAAEGERDAAIAALRRDLAAVDETYKADIEASRRDYAAKSDAWRATKVRLDEALQRQNARLAELDGNVDALARKLAGATGAERQQLEARLARLRQDRAGLQREVEGGACLRTTVPRGVIEALDATTRGQS